MSVNRTRSVRKSNLHVKRNAKNVYKPNVGARKSAVLSKLPQFSKLPQLSRLPRVDSFNGFWVVLLCFCIGSVVITGMCAGALWLHRVATTSDYFATQQVEVLGNVRMSKDMVKDYAGVHEGDNSLNISISKVEQSLLKTPWVKEVSVKRVLPNRFVITLNERLPSFWIKQDGVLFYADEMGNIIAPVETENFMSLPTLEIESGAESSAKMLAEYLQDLKSGKLPVEFGAISAFKVSKDKGIELYLDDREIRLCLELEAWKNNLQRLSITLGDLARRNELSRVREIRAADGNVWVITNT